ncbi:MAG TPA: sigma-70 family RNA polymerase sigma factor [Dongiaceae bacterium]|jgi:RNA polymerase sigma-70 factor (ECF subfamily)|nr:sigma-70 family RNA polymerase sigma factor [Dongiaceae bacterium]
MKAARAKTEGQTEVVLLQRIAGGDRDAFAELYRRLQRPLFGYLMKLVREREMVEDVLNETLMEVWRQAARFEGRSSVNTWVFSIAHHRAVSRLRKRREAALDEEQAAAIEDEGPTPDVRAESSDMSRLLGRLMEQLSFEHREILHLAYYQEFSVQEIADALDLPPNTVKTRMFYARQRLKVLLQESGVEGAVA